MNNRFSLILLSAALIACTQEKLQPIQETTTLKVGLSETTKTSLGPAEAGVRHLYWSEGDKICANGVVSSALDAKYDGSSAAEFEFPQAVTYPMTVLYPAEFYTSPSTVTLPQIQQYAKGSFATTTSPALAYIENESAQVNLKNVCSVVSFKLVKGAHNHPVKGVIFKGGAGEKVSGEFNVNYAEGTLSAAAGASDVLKLSTGELVLSAEPVEIFMVVPAGHYDGFTFRIVDTQNHFMDATKASGADLLPGKVYNMGATVTYAPTGTLLDAGLSDFGSTGAVVEKIGSASEWNTFATNYNNGKFAAITASNFAVQLTADLDFSSCSAQFVSIQSYSGGVEGQGHHIKNLSASAPLFQVLDNATVTELHIDSDCTFTSDATDSFGAIAAVVKGDGRNNIIEHCSCDATIVAKAAVAGGLVGTLESGTLMRYCTFSGKLTAPSVAGGIVGKLSDCDTDDCINYGSVITTGVSGSCGGVIGVTASDKCIVTNGGNYGKVVAGGEKHGLLVGEFKNLSALADAFVGGTCYDYRADGNHVRHEVGNTDWLTVHTGYGYAAVASKISGLSSSYGESSELHMKDAPLRILFIGNSFTDDAVKHLPGMIAAAGLSDKITMAHMYYGGRTMMEYNDWSLADYTLSKFEAGASSNSWVTHGSKVSIADVANDGRWDIITMQEHTGNWHGWVWNSDEKSYFDGMFNKLNATQKTKPAYWYILSHAYYDMNKIATGSRSYMTWPLENTRSAQLKMYETIIENGKKIMANEPFDGVLSTCSYVQNIRTSYLENSMDLTRDGYHMDYGITRYGAACLLFESLITPKFGVKLDDNTYRYTVLNTTSGSYSTPVTDENAPVALKAARYAMEKPYEIVDMSANLTKVSIIGDSISTFRDWISSTSVDGKKCTTHYPNTSNPACDVQSADKTWWYKIIYKKMPNARLDANISSGNTTVVANTTATSYAGEYWYNWDFCTRVKKLGVGNPDVIFIHGGTNDLGHITSYKAAECLIGTTPMNSNEAPDAAALNALFQTADAAVNVSSADALDGTTFCSAYIKLMQMLKVRHPQAKVVCIIGDCVSPGMQSAIKSIAQHYGAKYVDFLAINGFKGNSPLSKYDGSVHPDAAGMEFMASEIYKQVGAWLEE